MATPAAIAGGSTLYHRRLTHLRSTILKNTPRSRHGSVRKLTHMLIAGSAAVVPVTGNRVQLQQVLFNLVINAIDAMESVAEPLPTIAIGLISTLCQQKAALIAESGLYITCLCLGRRAWPHCGSSTGKLFMLLGSATEMPVTGAA